MSVVLGTIHFMTRCTRFHRDGTACTNVTEYLDGWCRQDDCAGFVRPNTSAAPETHGSPRGTDTHIRASPVEITDVTLDEIPGVHVTTRAVDSFRFHHGGSARSAEVQLRSMLEDFLVKSASSTSANGFVRLSRQGYDLVLSPDRTAITAYSTVHRERTWEQVKSHVPSRFRRHIPRRPSAVPRREPGEPVPPERFADVFDASEVYLTARVQRSFAKIEGLLEAPDEELHAAVRSCAAQLPAGIVTRRADGLFEVEHAGRIWLVTPDCRTLIGVKPVRTQDSTERSVVEIPRSATAPRAERL